VTRSRELVRFVTPESRCSYVPTETASLEYRIHLRMGVAQYTEMLQRGWRRHGAHFFRPACPLCTKCRSLRVDVDDFRPTRSQRKCRSRNSDVQIVLQRASVTTEHVRLYNAWHQDMTQRRGWSLQQISEEDYTNSFLIGEWAFAHEMLYLRNGVIIGVGLVDLLPQAISSVYFYHDREWRRLGPGTFSVLSEIEYARRTGRRHLYLGYAIRECPSMAYKFRFGPHELLGEHVSDDTRPVWTADAT
jgi:leucyl-tRNA---protein transferase